MATLDQLPADQRAILELVVQRGRSYQSLSDVLQIPPTRVRELARTALSHLAPVTGERVDPEWRGQIADYVLGQQSGPESTATRGHLKRSEAARAWTFSLIDSLDSLYGVADRPAVPDGDGGRVRERDRRAAAAEAEREREREAERERREQEEAERERERREREQWERERAERAERDREWERERERRERERDAGVEERPAEPARRPEVLSSEARRALRRRRLIGGLAAAVAILGIAAIVLVPITHAFSSGKKSDRHPGATNAANRVQIVGELPLRPAGSDKTATGLAVIAKRGNTEQLVVQAKMSPSQRGYAYEVWLYNSPSDVASLGAQVTDAQGNYQGAGPLPANFTRFKDIVISYEKIGTGTTLSGPIVLRGAFADLQAPPQTSSNGSATPAQPAPGATTTPATTAP